MTTTKQEIFRVRRRYNQWVSNQSLEDYALRFTAKQSRRWSLARVANTALGAISFLVLEAIGAAITINYGFENTLLAVAIVSLIIFFAGLPICFYAAKYGVDIDLLTRGAGFGYIGSTATSLIYSSFTFIFFALEAAIMAKAIELLTGLPLAMGYVVSSLIVIPLVFYGITFISRFQLWSQPIWVVLQLIPFVFILQHDTGLLNDWQNYVGSKQEEAGVNILLVGAAASVMFSLVAQIGEQVDFLRFFPEKNAKNKLRWWTALILSGPGWVIIGAIKILAGSFLAVVAIQQGYSLVDAGDPTTMYSVAFSFVTQNQHLALLLAGIFVILSQLKINVTNAYAGSIAWSNFFSRLTHSHPGRVVWLIFNVAIALLLMELGIYQAFENTLSVYAIVAVAWVGAIVADLIINKPLGLSPSYIEFKRAHLFDINPVGIGAMLIASALGITCFLGIAGELLKALAHLVALASTLICVPIIAILTKSKFYIARKPHVFASSISHVECTICKNKFEKEDSSFCPAYEGNICSLCCSIDSRCQDICKPTLNIGQRITNFVHNFTPSTLEKYINVRLFSFISLLLLVVSISGILLILIYLNSLTGNLAFDLLLENTIWNVFFILTIVAGVICWLFILAHESRLVAQEESNIQTRRLREEILAHKDTDKQLQIAKELAEAANNAKSRYLTGISHELRTPLNTVLGYAQLLEMDSSLPQHATEQLTIIRRSSVHLADLIEGLLDISKIEAGQIEVHRDTIELQQLMSQIVNMFKLQAENKGLTFTYETLSVLPTLVIGDEKRLRQILINLLSNALKFTEAGQVSLSVHYRNQVVDFTIKDTGVGIPETEMERIFRPFERVRRPESPSVSGTGLGLTITRLLTDIMGGDISVTNNQSGGCTFTVKLALPQTRQNLIHKGIAKEIIGYSGERKTVLVVDDEPAHRGLINDFLTPLGFSVVEAQNSANCLNLLNNFSPSIILLDRLMPDMDGPSLAGKLRERGEQCPILIISANAIEDGLDDDKEPAYDDYLIKPIKLSGLIQSIAKHLNIDWQYKDQLLDTHSSSTSELEHKKIDLPPKQLCDQISQLAKIGHIAGLKVILEELERAQTVDTSFIRLFKKHIQNVELEKLINIVQSNSDE
ncbi:ATP-binding protein [Agaribacterium sp. ZY112]|uniref:hybrid sensor histidine kinase/response regulator n=1 Tax=Agaribacterium sp. ZY112 TaxID=3233574 RepID=UPI003523F093